VKPVVTYKFLQLFIVTDINKNTEKSNFVILNLKYN